MILGNGINILPMFILNLGSEILLIFMGWHLVYFIWSGLKNKNRKKLEKGFLGK